MFPKMEMDEHREQRAKIAARIAELEKELRDYAKIIGEPNPAGEAHLR